MTLPRVLRDRNPWPILVAGCLGFWLLVGGCVSRVWIEQE